MILCKRCGKEINADCLDCIAEDIKAAKVATDSQLEEAKQLAQKIQIDAIEAIIAYLRNRDGDRE
jgi:cbb3-type cytochrome oxidase cytochrome c subunit